MTPLTKYFEQGSKHKNTHQIGLEVEHFLLSKKDGRPMPYEMVEALLDSLKEDYPKHYYEQDQLIGLESEDVLITLEPGCQLEISLACMENLEKIETTYLQAMRPILAYLAKHEYQCVYSGGLPTVSADQVDLIFKKRYQWMEKWFEKTGHRGHEMMKATAAVHVSIDYEDEADFIDKYRASCILHPLLEFLSSNTPKYAGKDNPDPLLRDAIWEDTDPERCGIFPGVFDEDFGFEAYAQKLLKTPLILMRDQDQFVNTQEKICEEVAKEYGMGPEAIQHYLSMVFFDIRLKNFIEIRSADSMPLIYTLAYCALIKGLFYKKETIQGILKWANSIDDIVETKRNLRQFGYYAMAYRKNASALLLDLILVAKQGLSSKETLYLNSLEQLVKEKQHIHELSIEESYRLAISMHPIESKESAMQITHAIQKSDLNLGGNMYTRTLHIPKIFTQEDKRRFQSIVKTTYGIFEKVILAYRKDAKIRDLFGFSKPLEQLILCEPSYASMIPICRVDIFYQEDTKDFYFCEFNTDGTSAMNENKKLNDFLALNNIYQKDPNAYEIMELVDSWADKLIEIAASDPSIKDHPRIAIVDFLENAYYTELYVFEDVFKSKGYDCEVVDIRNLEYRQGKMFSKTTGQIIDVVYRRAVTSDVMKHYDEIQPFIQAYLDHAFCCIGAFQTQLVHHKQIMQVLVDPQMKKYLTPQENEFILKHSPLTMNLKEDILPKLLEDKDQWIIKPKDSYASKGVFAGVDVHQDQWEKLLKENIDSSYIVQRYIHPYKSWNIDLVNFDEGFPYSNMTGLYVYDGEFAGVYSRLSDGGIISTQYNEKTISTLFLR